ncbi:MAG: site-specific DNA-methyltransferase [Acidimicrobiaceae bacterium]|nr:site-specific DNA-methyltransferase [Acidimicrobiaceae bacterium]
MGRREGHDASEFYDRFPLPEISDQDEIMPHACVDRLWVGDARDMDDDNVADDSVALVVTSPPYFVGKEYELAMGQGDVPADYIAYLRMLEDVLAECVRKLEPGGRIAVNVANLGRRPYRSLSADVIEILQNRLQLLLRGEVIWRKAQGAAGSCAWGSFQRPGNPVLRDVTERIIIASKGRFDRALSAAERAKRQLPSIGTVHVDEFMEATTDVWDIPPASATRVGHPAPFPVELPKRLIELYTYKGDLVLDPFMGAGTTAVAAVRTGRYYVGFDIDKTYIDLAEQRVAEERKRLAKLEKQRNEKIGELSWPVAVGPSRQQSFELDNATGVGDNTGDNSAGSGSAGNSTAASAKEVVNYNFQARAGREGRKAREMARVVLLSCGFSSINDNVARVCGAQVNFEAFDQQGGKWLFDVSGAFSVTQRPGLRRTDTLWKALGKAAVIHSAGLENTRLVLLTTNRPTVNSSGYRALKALTGPNKPVREVIVMRSPVDIALLKSFASGECSDER